MQLGRVLLNVNIEIVSIGQCRTTFIQSIAYHKDVYAVARADLLSESIMLSVPCDLETSGTPSTTLQESTPVRCASRWAGLRTTRLCSTHASHAALGDQDLEGVLETYRNCRWSAPSLTYVAPYPVRYSVLTSVLHRLGAPSS